jgi:hypothetical protein
MGYSQAKMSFSGHFLAATAHFPSEIRRRLRNVPLCDERVADVCRWPPPSFHHHHHRLCSRPSLVSLGIDPISSLAVEERATAENDTDRRGKSCSKFFSFFSPSKAQRFVLPLEARADRLPPRTCNNGRGWLKCSNDRPTPHLFDWRWPSFVSLLDEQQEKAPHIPFGACAPTAP